MPSLDAAHTDSKQVTGDLWERYMVMLTQENKLEV